MKNKIKVIFTGLILTGWMISCNQAMEQKGHNDHEESIDTHKEEGDGNAGENELHLSDLKFQSLGIKVDTLPTRPLSGVVYANGQLEVPPQHEATVTAIMGGNVTSIKVIEGDRVNKGQSLAYISHPDFTRLQADYMRAFSRLEFLEQEFQRQKKLYDEKIGSGKTFQQTESELNTLKVELKGYEAQLKQLKLDPEKVRKGEIYENIPVPSPISGYIEKVLIQIGQYVQPQTSMFLVMNTEHIHADLMVFEKDVSKVQKGQTISFTIESVSGSELTAKIYAVGRQFEENPKAVHIHAEIQEKEDYLIPGMYINGKIHTTTETVTALPEEAVIEENGNPHIFLAEKHDEDGETEWSFKPVEIRKGASEKGWVEIKLLEPLPDGAQVAWNNGYYLISEMNKSQTEHSH